MTVHVERSITLPCDAPTAWAILTDWEEQATWMRDADSVRVVSADRTGVGVRLAVRTRLLGIPAFTEPMEVTRWDPPRVLTIRHGGPVRGEGTWRLTEHGPSVTRFTWTEDVGLAVPLLGETAAWCYRPLMRILMGRGQADLRRRLQAR
ncbi:MAG: SRPBCC family protein [Actinomycetota bacterium]